MNLINIIFIVVFVYLIFLAFSKITKLILRVIIIILLVGFLFLGYNNLNDFLNKGATDVKDTMNDVHVDVGNITPKEEALANTTINITNDTTDAG